MMHQPEPGRYDLALCGARVSSPGVYMASPEESPTCRNCRLVAEVNVITELPNHRVVRLLGSVALAVGADRLPNRAYDLVWLELVRRNLV